MRAEFNINGKLHFILSLKYTKRVGALLLGSLWYWSTSPAFAIIPSLLAWYEVILQYKHSGDGSKKDYGIQML